MKNLNIYVSYETGQIVTEYEKAYFINVSTYKYNTDPTALKLYSNENDPKRIEWFLETVYHNIENDREYAEYLLRHKPILNGYIEYLKAKYKA